MSRISRERRLQQSRELAVYMVVAKHGFDLLDIRNLVKQTSYEIEKVIGKKDGN
jgi:hypothetical protein